MKTYQGGCHCKQVRYEIEADISNDVVSCNCSMCNMVGFVHLIVPKHRFRLLSGESSLSQYQFNTGVAKHLFCSNCGVKSFYVPRSNPNGFSINVRCLDSVALGDIDVGKFDGQNWEQHAHSLTNLSE